ncbi:hypothetical protein GOP47_0018258 [Adiantum capillus-veneris]|uniref:Uncharacterized protein n=1 Tax=Adiantum capillus-veneris TaxID=13818 RepID=A0A9D4UH08_ADICA|nr:hypothetical protein GOP47_0018258 [Adiantum capillus-veneris]
MESTRRLWKERFPHEPYLLDLTQFQYDQQWKPPKQGELSNFKYNLHEAAARQSAFYYQVSRSHMKDEKYLRGAEQRYKGFLHLYSLTQNKLFLVPTYDIDLLWHAHQLNVKCYTDDMRRILDRLLPHDDSVADRTPGSRLEKSSILTHKLWLERYGKPYIREGAMYRGEPPAPVPIPLQGETVTSLLPDIGGSFRYTTKESREVMQITLTIVRARDLPMVARKSSVGSFTDGKQMSQFSS